MKDEIVCVLKVKKINELYEITTSYEDGSFKVTKDFLIKNKLFKDNCFKVEDFLKIKASLNIDYAFNRALGYINYQDRSEKEVRVYLDKFNLYIDDVNLIINKLKTSNFINDERFTKIFVEQKIRVGMGKKAISYQLKLKGINEDIIQNAMDLIDDTTLETNALEIANITLKKCIGLPVVKQKETIIKRLTHMGYSMDQINYCLSNVTYSDVSKELLEKEVLKLYFKKLPFNTIYSKLIQKGYDSHSINEIYTKVKNENE